MKPTLQSWKWSDWRVSWIASFSLRVPDWAVAEEEEEEEAAVKPSSTFLMLNFFILLRYRRETVEKTDQARDHELDREVCRGG